MSGAQNEDIGAIAEQIINWVSGVRWGDQQDEKAERLIESLNAGPDAYIDPALSASTNYEMLKEEFGLQTARDREKIARDTREQDRRRAFDEIRDQLETFGVESVITAVAEDDPEAVPTELEQRVDDVLEVLPPDAYDGVIQDHLSDVLATIAPDLVVLDRANLDREREAGRLAGRRESREILEDAFGEEFGSMEAAADFFDSRVREVIENETELREAAERAARQDILDGLGETFNGSFDTVADARQNIRQRAQREGEQAVLNELATILNREILTVDDALDALRDELGIVPDEPNDRAERAIDLLQQ